MTPHLTQYQPPATIDDLNTLKMNSLGQLVVALNDGTEHVNVQAVRGFPITQPDFGISLVNDEGAEVLWIKSLSECLPEVQKCLQNELAMRDFLPEISRVYHVSSNYEPCEWDVETDRGRVKFVLKNDEDVRRIDATRAIITDAHGVQYLVRDIKKMDTVSRRYVERYI